MAVERPALCFAEEVTVVEYLLSTEEREEKKLAFRRASRRKLSNKRRRAGIPTIDLPTPNALGKNRASRVDRWLLETPPTPMVRYFASSSSSRRRTAKVAAPQPPTPAASSVRFGSPGPVAAKPSRSVVVVPHSRPQACADLDPFQVPEWAAESDDEDALEDSSTTHRASQAKESRTRPEEATPGHEAHTQGRAKSGAEKQPGDDEEEEDEGHEEEHKAAEDGLRAERSGSVDSVDATAIATPPTPPPTPVHAFYTPPGESSTSRSSPVAPARPLYGRPSGDATSLKLEAASSAKAALSLAPRPQGAATSSQRPRACQVVVIRSEKLEFQERRRALQLRRRSAAVSARKRGLSYWEIFATTFLFLKLVSHIVLSFVGSLSEGGAAAAKKPPSIAYS